MRDLNIPKIHKKTPKMHVTLSSKSLKTGNSLMKNYYSVPEGQRKSGKFPGKKENVSKSEIAAVIYFPEAKKIKRKLLKHLFSNFEPRN